MAPPARDRSTRPAPRERDWRRVELEYKARLPWRLIRRCHELGPEKLLRRARAHGWDRERLTPAQVLIIAGRATSDPDLSPDRLPHLGPPRPHPPASYFLREEVEAFLTAQLSALTLEERIAVARLRILLGAVLGEFARRLDQPGGTVVLKRGLKPSFVAELEFILTSLERLHRLERQLYAIPEQHHV